jgi:hypothetical protein
MYKKGANMNRRGFLAAGVGVLAGFSLIKAFVSRKNNTNKIDFYDVQRQPDGSYQHYRYIFQKGPDYKNLEQAYPYMQEIINSFNHNYINNKMSNSVVLLECITYHPGIFMKGA